ncbi:hypothetical protein CGRA01v4_02954 [Colletotrichum graminicola]|nr:hypothetical protein CGRA01v4_02954 [Colletotrichum graminicola]
MSCPSPSSEVWAEEATCSGLAAQHSDSLLLLQPEGSLLPWKHCPLGFLRTVLFEMGCWYWIPPPPSARLAQSWVFSAFRPVESSGALIARSEADFTCLGEALTRRLGGGAKTWDPWGPWVGRRQRGIPRQM